MGGTTASLSPAITTETPVISRALSCPYGHFTGYYRRDRTEESGEEQTIEARRKQLGWI
jgi:hypothetical protein